MKIAILYQHVSLGGGIRFFKCLVQALVKNYESITINIYADLNFIREEGRNYFFSDLDRVNLIPYGEKKLSIYYLRKILSQNLIGLFFSKVLKRLGFGLSPVFSKETLDEINENDLLYLPWPFFLKPCDIKIPLFGTFHDFNYMHPSFGNFGIMVAKVLHRQTRFWLQRSSCPIVSSEFIKSELDKFYPFASKKTKVVHVSTFIFNEKKSLKYLNSSFDFKNFPSDYILYPSNTAFHKNHLNLFEAFGILKRDKINIPLLLVGNGTENIQKYYLCRKFNLEYFYFNHLVASLKKNDLIPGKDIFLMGYVSDEDVYGIIKNAKLLVSPTLYEAGSGPGLDAWHIGTPVAFSNITPHRNHMDFLKTQAWTFDPRNPKNIADTIKKALVNEKETTQKMVRISKESMQKYTWNNIAEQYYNVFEQCR